MIGTPNLRRNHTIGQLVTYAKSDCYSFCRAIISSFFVTLLLCTMIFVFTLLVLDNTRCMDLNVFRTTVRKASKLSMVVINICHLLEEIYKVERGQVSVAS